MKNRGRFPFFHAALAAVFCALAQPASGALFVVSTSADTANGVGACDAGGATPCSLRQAVNAANADPADQDSITFKPGITTANISSAVSAGGIASQGPVTIDGGGTVTIVVNPGTAGLVLSNSNAGAATTTLMNLTIDGQGTSATANGGGIQATAPAGPHTITLDHVTMQRLTATSQGGAIDASGTGVSLNLVDSTLRDNHGGGGGGGILVSDAKVHITRSTLSGNQANVGGAIDLFFGASGAGTVTMADSTLSGNSAQLGGAIYANVGGLKISFSTIARNTASAVGQAAVDMNSATTNRFKATIFNNPAAAQECSNTSPMADGYNFIRDSSCKAPSDEDRKTHNHPATPIAVGELADNGGPTQTMALSPPNAAIDAVPAVSCSDIDGNAVSVDQRGAGRDGSCEAGAFEIAAPPSDFAPPSVTGTAAVGRALTCDPGVWSGSPSFTYQWKRDGASIGSATLAIYTVAAADAGHRLVCHVTATNLMGTASADSVALAVARTRPLLSAFRFSRTRVSFRLSEAAVVRFTIQRRVRRHRRTRYVRVGSFTHKGAAGRNRFRFSGRVGGRRLRRGSYRAVAVARDAAGHASKPAKRAFRVAG